MNGYCQAKFTERVADRVIGREFTKQYLQADSQCRSVNNEIVEFFEDSCRLQLYPQKTSPDHLFHEMAAECFASLSGSTYFAV